MKIIILPGYSVKNRIWAEATKREFEQRLEDVDIKIVNWRHWSSGDSSQLRNEHERIIQMLGTEPVTIIAKSIGTWVAMNVIAEAKERVNKLILCGVPLGETDTNAEEKLVYKNLAGMDADKVMVIQNSTDTHGTHAEVQEFMKNIHPGIKVIEKPGNTHDYFYSSDFAEFLVGAK